MSYQTVLTQTINANNFPLWKEALALGLIDEEGKILKPLYLVEIHEMDHDHPYGLGQTWWALATTETSAFEYLKNWNIINEEMRYSSDAWATRYIPRPILRAGMGRYVHREF